MCSSMWPRLARHRLCNFVCANMGPQRPPTGCHAQMFCGLLLSTMPKVYDIRYLSQNKSQLEICLKAADLGCTPNPLPHPGRPPRPSLSRSVCVLHTSTVFYVDAIDSAAASMCWCFFLSSTISDVEREGDMGSPIITTASSQLDQENDRLERQWVKPRVGEHHMMLCTLLSSPYLEILQ